MTILTKIRQTIKILGVAGIILAYFANSGLILLFVQDRWKAVDALTKNIAKWCRRGLVWMGIRIEGEAPELPTNENFLIVGNHQSYLDILVQSSRLPTCFVTSQEIKETPFLGHLCRLGGCLFVERRSRKNLHQEIRELTEGLRHGLSVTVFPEATSTNGDSVIRFRRPLYNAAIDSKTRVLPAIIRYETLDGEPVDTSNRDDVCWYGDMTFFSHLWNLLKYREIKVRLDYLPPLNITDDTTAADIAHESYSQISSWYRPYESPAVSAEKCPKTSEPATQASSPSSEITPQAAAAIPTSENR